MNEYCWAVTIWVVGSYLFWAFGVLSYYLNGDLFGFGPDNCVGHVMDRWQLLGYSLNYKG